MAIQKVLEKCCPDCKKGYSLIFMDINMPPGIDGFETTEIITKKIK